MDWEDGNPGSPVGGAIQTSGKMVGVFTHLSLSQIISLNNGRKMAGGASRAQGVGLLETEGIPGLSREGKAPVCFPRKCMAWRCPKARLSHP